MKNKPWSYSRVKSFETCPFQYYHLKVIKTYQEPETQAMIYGNLFHEAAEEYIRDGTPLPDKFLYAKDALDALDKLPGKKLCEYKMGLLPDLTACEFDDPDVWYRGIADLTILNKDKARVIDYKTGKSAKYADMGQLELMALATFAHFPTVDRAQTALMYVVSNEFISDSYLRSDIPALWEKWLTKHAAFEKAHKRDVWNKRPSGLCKAHCMVLECAHNGRN